MQEKQINKVLELHNGREFLCTIAVEIEYYEPRLYSISKRFETIYWPRIIHIKEDGLPIKPGQLSEREQAELQEALDHVDWGEELQNC